MLIARKLVVSLCRDACKAKMVPTCCHPTLLRPTSPARTMATAKDVQAALRQLLPILDINTSTERQIRDQLTHTLGPIEEHKKLIKQEIDNYLAGTLQQQQQQLVVAGNDNDIAQEDIGPKRKRGAPAGNSDDAAAKRGREANNAAAVAGSESSPGIQLDTQGTKFASLSTFRGQQRIDLRTYYRDKQTGALKPTQKGISLSTSEWQSLQQLLPQVSEALRKRQDFTRELTSAVRVTASVFQNKLQVGIREFYEKDGEQCPGKKGISLSADQYKQLVNTAVPQLNKELGGAAPAPAAAAAKTDFEAVALPAATIAAAETSNAVASKPAAATAANGAGSSSTIGDVDLGGRKRAAISTFMKGRPSVDLRETYEKDGNVLPGRKGILLKPEEWKQICREADTISEALDKRDTEYKLNLGSNACRRQVAISEFKGTCYVNVREYYEKVSQMLPGVNLHTQSAVPDSYCMQLRTSV
eukprot:GHRR01007316.1.p1 GENE.GHRR01007316.1~~GHRR01007316.1.p1  ORF type:complete len:472 (+),score=174.73 GHRR01007316.1:139-1554(+)